MTQTENQLREEIQSFDVIDSHEHLPEEETLPDPDFIGSSIAYFITDLVGAGMSWDRYSYLIDPTIDICDRWNFVAPFWEKARYTGYGQCVERSMAELYGVDRIDESTVVELNRRFRAAHKNGHYREVLKDKCRIKISVNDLINDMKFTYNPLFAFVERVDRMVEPSCRQDILCLAKENGKTIQNFQDYEALCVTHLDRILTKGYLGLKCGAAYRRSLLFRETPREEAEKIFVQLMESENTEKKFDCTSFQDYMMHFVLRAADERHMLLQIHTGLLAGQGILSNTNPMLLNQLFEKYPHIRFDIFHTGYPFIQEVGTLAKMYPNVHVNMCWSHIISPVASVRALEEWFAFLPTNKIIGFGGDSCAIDNVLGHLRMAQENIARALAFHVEDGLFSLSQAKQIAKRLLYDNPASLYQL